MLSLIAAVTLILVFGIAYWRHIAGRRRMTRFATGIRERHALKALFVSKLDRSFIALCLDDRHLVLGREANETVYPLSDVIAVEEARQVDKGRIRRLEIVVRLKGEAAPEHRYLIQRWTGFLGPLEDAGHIQPMLEHAARVRAMLLDAARLNEADLNAP
jgi:hypothetical protein